MMSSIVVEMVDVVFGVGVYYVHNIARKVSIIYCYAVRGHVRTDMIQIVDCKLSTAAVD